MRNKRNIFLLSLGPILLVGIIVSFSIMRLNSDNHNGATNNIQQQIESKADEFLEMNYPDMNDAQKYYNKKEVLPYWEFGYRKDMETKLDDGDQMVMITKAVIIRIDKKSGEIESIIAN